MNDLQKKSLREALSLLNQIRTLVTESQGAINRLDYNMRMSRQNDQIFHSDRSDARQQACYEQIVDFEQELHKVLDPKTKDHLQNAEEWLMALQKSLDK